MRRLTKIRYEGKPLLVRSVQGNHPISCRLCGREVRRGQRYYYPQVGYEAHWTCAEDGKGKDGWVDLEEGK